MMNQANTETELKLYTLAKITGGEDPAVEGIIGVLVDLFPEKGYGIIELNDEDEERLGRMVVSTALENLVPVPNVSNQAA
jgi:hypothetical protein